MIRRPPRSTLSSSSAASDVYKRQRSLCARKVKSPGRGLPVPRIALPWSSCACPKRKAILLCASSRAERLVGLVLAISMECRCGSCDCKKMFRIRKRHSRYCGAVRTNPIEDEMIFSHPPKPRAYETMCASEIDDTTSYGSSADAELIGSVYTGST